MQFINIDKIKPASYNPRKISDKQFEKLKQSIKFNGFVIPILVNQTNMTIIAGHQRTKAASSIGLERVPAFFCENINKADEIKFNQIHNGTDNEMGAVAYLNSDKQPGFYELSHQEFIVSNKNASVVKEICKLLIKYGNVLCCVIDTKGSVIGANYVWACKLLNLSVNTSVIKNTEHRSYLNDSYGVFAYDKLTKHTWVQGLAQLQRDASDKKTDKKKQKSALYENLVIPFVRRLDRPSILDFGCGKGAYIESFNRSNTIGIEFYNNNRKSIDITKGNKQITNLINHLEKQRKFNVVICDSVLNSVDCLEAENAILGCLNLFCETGGDLFISGRPTEGYENKLTRKTDKNVGKRFIEFMDRDNFTANFRNGQWYYQHFHNQQYAVDLVENNGFEVIDVHWMKHGDSWQIHAKKRGILTKEQYRQSVDYEFNLPLPGGCSYQRNGEIKKVCRLN